MGVCFVHNQNVELRPFQRQFLQKATQQRIDTSCLSLPRGNGKSWLAGHLVSRVLSPDDDLFVPNTESVLCAASLEQARIVFRFARGELEPRGGFRFLDSHQRIGITHVETNTRLRVIGSNGRTAMGLVNTPWVICDEPGSWEVNGGQLLHDAIETAKGKPGSPLRAVYIGTLAPSMSGWWHDLVETGTHGSAYVQALRGNPDKWDLWAEIRRCNPLTAVSPEFRAKLLDERDQARRDSRLKARFMSYRLNIPSGDESTMLLTVDDWKEVLHRDVRERSGKPIFSYDLGGGRAWSAVVAIWRTGRIEALAVAPGIPHLEEQEKRDRVPRGTYRHLHDLGVLRVADGLRVQPPALLHHAACEAFGAPESIYCDRFRVNEIRDVTKVPVVARVTRWSEASEDIRALRKLALDGPLSCPESSRTIIAASLAFSSVKNDDQGSVRLVKKDMSNNTGRDDVAAALVLAAGAFGRGEFRQPRKVRWALAG